MTTARIELPPKLIPVFAGDADYRGAYGGRGSAKTRSFSLMLAVRGYAFGKAGRSGILLGCREFMNSLEDSSFEEIRECILATGPDGEYLYPWLVDYYHIGDKFIRSKDGKIRFVFSGMRHNLNSIKGKSRILIAWADEAETISKAAWDKLDATIREDGSELWVTWNPEDEDSETKKRFQDNPPPNSKIVEMNWRDNPWFPERLNRIRLHCQENNPELYAHIWEGACHTRTDAQIFSGKWRIEDFEPDSAFDGPYYGLDFGFAQDPTAATECWIKDNSLYIRHEAGRVGLELDDTAPFMLSAMPGMAKTIVRADCARPESISFIKRNGLPLLIPASKWSGSVEDGIEFMRSFRSIIVHSDCVETARELRLYSYKVDRLTGDIRPVPVDAYNHYIDSIRYALEPMIGAAKGRKPAQPNKPDVDAWGRRRMGGESWKTM